MDNKYTSNTSSTTDSRKNNLIWIALAIAAVILVALIASALANKDDQNTDNLVPANSTATPQPTYTTSPSNVILSPSITTAPNSTTSITTTPVFTLSIGTTNTVTNP